MEAHPLIKLELAHGSGLRRVPGLRPAIPHEEAETTRSGQVGQQRAGGIGRCLGSLLTPVVRRRTAAAVGADRSDTRSRFCVRPAPHAMAGRVEPRGDLRGSTDRPLLLPSAGQQLSPRATSGMSRRRGAEALNATPGRPRVRPRGSCSCTTTPELPVGARQMLVGQLVDDGLGMACFRLRFDREHPMLRLYAWCSRFDSVWTTFGDQGYLIRRSVFEAVGGFPNWPLFEDVELPRRVRRLPGLSGSHSQVADVGDHLRRPVRTRRDCQAAVAKPDRNAPILLGRRSDATGGGL
jgi:hypothetical protein